MSRNKTITLQSEQIEVLSSRCKTVQNQGDNAIIIGSVFDSGNFVAKESVDLMIVDPPYNMAKNFGGYKTKKVSSEEYEKFTRKWIEEFFPLLQKNASVYVCCDWESSLVIGRVLGEYFIVRNRITWQREKGRGSKNNWKNGMEDIWYCTVGEDFTFNLNSVKIRRKVLAPYKTEGKAKDWFENSGEKYRDTCPSNFWDDITVPYWSMSENTPHPTQKPEKLMAKLILASSNENDTVFEPFAGSGSASVTAKKLGRKSIAIEQNPYYGAIARFRLDEADENKRIQGYDGVFYERNAKMGKDQEKK